MEENAAIKQVRFLPICVTSEMIIMSPTLNHHHHHFQMV